MTFLVMGNTPMAGDRRFWYRVSWRAFGEPTCGFSSQVFVAQRFRMDEQRANIHEGKESVRAVPLLLAVG